MTSRKLWTAAELENLSPADRAEIIRDGIVTDLDQVPQSFLERVQANIRDHIASNETAPTAER